MTLGNMRKNGVHAVTATCEDCGHKADVVVGPAPRDDGGPRGGSEPPVQSVREQTDQYAPRLAHDAPTGHGHLNDSSPNFFAPAVVRDGRGLVAQLVGRFGHLSRRHVAARLFIAWVASIWASRRVA